jgi:hypothetical protein|tara:strand:- start:271 stop:519 length:249 start_codon:yes stop_codon:yes gene_type:complete
MTEQEYIESFEMTRPLMIRLLSELFDAVKAGTLNSNDEAMQIHSFKHAYDVDPREMSCLVQIAKMMSSNRAAKRLAPRRFSN